MASFICSLILLAALIFSCWHYQNLKDKVGNLNSLNRVEEETKTRIQRLADEEFDLKQKLSGLQENIACSEEEALHKRETLITLRSTQNELENSLANAQSQVAAQMELLDNYSNQYNSILNMHNERCKKAEDEANAKIALTEQECARLIGEHRLAAQRMVDQFAIDAENERQKYLSIVATIANAQTDEERDAARHVRVNEVNQDDIGYLLNNVVRHLSNPDILYKLIWSEYIQKATNEMLDYILPQKDCPGIYKITNDRNKKSYIGRSTSVRKRLADHIKSAIGISTIANQKIHEVMREEGIWNFTFELIEECDKDKLSEREKYYIDFFQTADTTYGYNQKAGG